MGTVFINYRRADSEAWTLLLHKEFVDAFGHEAVILDVHDLEPGAEYEAVVLSEIRDASAMVVVIGPQWLTITDDEEPGPRLFRDDDLLRREIETALEAGIEVIPALVGGAQMPRASRLPPTIAGLAGKNARTVSRDYLANDPARIASVIERTGVERLQVSEAPRPGILAWLSSLPVWGKVGGGAVVALAAVLVALQIGPSEDTVPTTGPAVTPQTATTAPQTVTSATSGPPTSSEDPPESAAPARCIGGVPPSVPVEAQNVDVIEADFDGDGAQDQLFVYNVAASEDFYRFRAVLAYGYAYELASEILFTFPPEFIASVDLDGDGDLEAFANYAGGASTVRIALLDFSGCVLTEFAELYVAGSIGGGGGFECLFGAGGDDLAVYSYEHQGDLIYHVDVTTYSLEGGVLKETDRREDIRVNVDDPLFEKSAGITCGNMQIGF